MVLDLQDLQRADVDQGMQPLDRMGVVIVEWKGAHPDEAVEHPATLLDDMAEVADGPRIDTHEIDLVEQPAAAQCLPESRILLDRLFDLQNFLECDHGPSIFAEDLGEQRAGGEVEPAGNDAHHATAVD